MTDIVVTSDSNTAILDTHIVQNIITPNEQGFQTIVTGLIGPPGPPGVTRLAELTDVNNTGLVDGATLAYNATTLQWAATKILDNQILEAGQF